MSQAFKRFIPEEEAHMMNYVFPFHVDGEDAVYAAGTVSVQVKIRKPYTVLVCTPRGDDLWLGAETLKQAMAVAIREAALRGPLDVVRVG